MSKPISELRAVANRLGRKGVSDLATKFIDECDGSPKGVMELAGKLSIIAKMSTFDCYWNEQVYRGVDKAEIEVIKLEQGE